MFRADFAKSFYKDCRKLDREFLDLLLTKIVPKILENPSIGDRFKGRNLRHLSKFAVRFKRTDYRLVYQVLKQEVVILFIAVGSRENFYKKI